MVGFFFMWSGIWLLSMFLLAVGVTCYTTVLTTIYWACGWETYDPLEQGLNAALRGRHGRI